MSTRSNRFQAWLDMMILDHGFLRIWWHNLHEIAPGVWRSNQPSPGQLKKLVQKSGIKTVLNLRGESTWGSYRLEKHTCDQLGVELIDARLYSRKPPTVAEVERLFAIFDYIDKPFLMHCKSGADRAGLGSALYMLWDNRVPAEAVRQLSWTYLHMKHAKTGMLDEFVATYAKAHAETGVSFTEWLHNVYDMQDMMDNFQASHIANWVVDRVLARE
ncbi:MAG: tyrosine-protein phosphatase [Pseudomonadota bacterium]